MHFHNTHASLPINGAEEHKRGRIKVEVGVRLALEARQRAEEQHTWLDVPPILPSAARAYAPLLWSWEVMHTYRENALFCDTRIIDMIAVVILHKLT